jgi:hypothetical protein
MSTTAAGRPTWLSLTGRGWRPALGVAAVFCAAIAGSANGAPPSSRELDRLLATLSSRTIPGHVSESLVDKYARAGTSAGPLKFDEDGFTESEFPIRLSEFEEWPAAMNGAFPFLESPAYEQLVQLLTAVRGGPAEDYTVVERIVAQSELWVVFDTLYLDGISPRHEETLDRPRWRRLLWETAQTMRHLAPTPEEVEALSPPQEALATVFGKDEFPKSAEFWNVERYFFHDVANEFRRSTHVRIYDPEIDFRNLTRQQLTDVANREVRLHVGGRALLQENAIAITTSLTLAPTPVPLALKSYRRAEGSSKGEPLTFDVYRFKRTVRELSPDALERFPDDAEGWAHIPLPNIPARAQSRYRAPLRETVCALCHHSTIPSSFNPGYEGPRPGSVRVSARARGYTEERNMRYKALTPEARALRAYMHSRTLDGVKRELPQITLLPLTLSDEEESAAEAESPP